MTIREIIQSNLVKACSGVTSNVYYYLIAITKEFTTNDTLVTYELTNVSNQSTMEFKNVIRNYDCTIKVTSNKQNKILDLNVFISKQILNIKDQHIGYISLTNEEQPIYNTDNMMFTSEMTFNILYTG